MTAAQIIGEIQGSSRTGRSGPELTSLVRQLADASTESDAGRMREELERGFYGKPPGA